MSAGPARPAGSDLPVAGERSGPEPPDGQPHLRVDRAAAFAAAPPRFPRKALLVGGVVIVAIGVGAEVGDQLLTNSSRATVPEAPPVTIAPLPSSHTRLASFLGLTVPRPRDAPGFSLLDQRGQRLSLASLRGKVVVLSFLDAACTGICPVVAAELADAERDLGAAASGVVLVTIDANPFDHGRSGARHAAAATGLGSLTSWHFLAGPLAALDRVWSAYGITIEVATNSGRAAYTQVIDLVDRNGKLVYKMTPFANELRSTGRETLPEPDVTHYGAGIATYVKRLLRR